MSLIGFQRQILEPEILLKYEEAKGSYAAAILGADVSENGPWTHVDTRIHEDPVGLGSVRVPKLELVLGNVAHVAREEVRLGRDGRTIVRETSTLHAQLVAGKGT
jgi:hypothetical protein